jgi:hypothetical protein
VERWHGHLRRWFLTVVPTREDLGEKSIVQDHHSGEGVRVEPRVAAWGGRPPRVRRRRTGAHMSCCTGFHLIDTRLACCRFCSSRYSPHRTRFCSSKNINAPLHLALFFFFFTSTHKDAQLTSSTDPWTRLPVNHERFETFIDAPPGEDRKQLSVEIE